MAKLRMCCGQRANEPYFFSSACTNIYSIEELCYMFALNPFMINEDIVSSELVDWIRNECLLGELSDKLQKYVNKSNRLTEFVITIIDYVNYCDEAEKQLVEDTLKDNSGLDDLERKKNQIDYLARNQKYEIAIEEYEKLLNEIPQGELSVTTKVYQNIGYCYAKMFMFDVAARYYKRAYELSGDEDAGVSFLCASRVYMPEEKYINFISNNENLKDISLLLEKRLKTAIGNFETSQEYLMLNALSIYKDEGNVASYYEEIDKVIAGMKDDYLKSVIN